MKIENYKELSSDEIKEMIEELKHSRTVLENASNGANISTISHYYDQECEHFYDSNTHKILSIESIIPREFMIAEISQIIEILSEELTNRKF